MTEQEFDAIKWQQVAHYEVDEETDEYVPKKGDEE